MDGATFDTWTRRRLNLALGGAGLSALLGVLGLADAEGKKKKKKKRKKRCTRKLGGRCKDAVPCCKGTGMECVPPISNLTKPRCCLPGLKACTADGDCCSGSCVDGACSCKATGQPCAGLGSLCCSLKCVGQGEDATCQP